MRSWRTAATIALLWAVLWGLVGCGGADPDVSDVSPVVLRVFLDGKPKSGGGALVVQAEYDAEGNLALPEPVGGQPGNQVTLEFTPDGPPVEERIGDRNVVTQRYVFRGKAGSYEIPPLLATWRGQDGTELTGESTPVFVDIDTEFPREGEIAQIIEPAPVQRWPWLVIGAVGALFAGGVLLAFRPRRAVAPIVRPPLPPHLAAIAAWEKVRDDRSLTIDDKAREVARIFREYVEAVLGFEATSRTTLELLEHLQSLRHLPDGNVPRAKRVLRAADRVKFAEDRPREQVDEWLAELDADLRAFVDSTKPSAWNPESR